jgi:maltokinase
VKEQLKIHLQNARWFGGKGREFEVADVRRLSLPGSADAETTAPLGLVTIELVTVRYQPDGDTDVYQVPMSYYLGERPRLNHALVGVWEDDELGHVWAYDALHDHSATPLWLQGFAEGSPLGDLTFHRVADAVIDVNARSTVLTAEQSNSSLVFGEDSLMKVFRRVTPGHNPDIEILAALTEAGNEHVASLYGWVETDAGGAQQGEVLQLGILQQFLRTASDGWELALASLRNLYSDGTANVEESGGDFASEAHRLGASVADMHSSLATAFPTETWGADQLGRLADDMHARLDAALAVVPEVEEHAAGLRAVFDSVRHLDRPFTVQRVHGDLHLGQTLRTVKNWKIIDFEGEPAKALEERRLPDSPWRDVAGMLRSFSYAAELSRLDRQQAVADDEGTVVELAREWASRNRKAFLAGYQEATDAELDDALITAYAADKAVYEAVYEARNRPSWLPIPLAALAHLAAKA